MTPLGWYTIVYACEWHQKVVFCSVSNDLVRKVRIEDGNIIVAWNVCPAKRGVGIPLDTGKWSQLSIGSEACSVFVDCTVVVISTSRFSFKHFLVSSTHP